MDSLDFITWSDEYSVHVKEMDDQHKVFFSKINEVLKFMRDPKVLKKTLKELADYADYHFSLEEKYLKKFQCENFESHKELHRMYVRRINEFKDRLKDDEDIALPFEMIDFLENWFTNHILQVDKGYTKCMNDHGLK
jgi:hemerythrin-like metal-binding protein